MSSTPIQFIQRSGLLVLLVPGTADESDFAGVGDLMAERLGLPGTPPLSGIAVDLTGWNDPNAEKWHWMTGQLANIPGKNRFFVMGVASGLQKLIAAQNGGLTLELFASIDEVFEKLTAKREKVAAKADTAKPKAKEDKALEKLMIKTFQEAAIHTLEIQCSTKFKAGASFVKTSENRIIHDIAASMGMMSKTVSGSVALGFKEETFLKIMSKMLGEDYTSLSRDVEDGCGELLNIIFGQAKKVLNESGHQFGKTLPSIFIGQSLRVRQLTPNPAFVLPFESSLGQMVIEVGYRHT